MTTEKRAYGDQGEEAAARFLVKEGYHLLERNWRIGHLEVDIIAEHFGLLVFVEVKTRRSEDYESAAETVSHNKQGHLIEAARVYCAEYRRDNPIRFDIITIVGCAPSFTITHIPDAFSTASHARVEQAMAARRRKPYIPRL